MNILFISIIVTIIGIVLFIKEKRSFITGLILMAGFFGIGLYFIDSLFDNEIIRFITLGIVYGLIPILIIMSGFLFIKNGKTMITKEGRNLSNTLSLIVGVDILIIVLCAATLIFYDEKINSFTHIMLVAIIIIAAYLGILFMSYLIYSYAYQKLPVKKKLDYIIVLGSGLIGDKVPPLLKSRLDKGIEVYKNQIGRGNNTKIIVSGGQGADELVSEASAMRKYLISQNINDKDILVEDRSRTTYENMRFSKEIMDAKGKYTCTFVTNNYHVFRAAIFARKVGLKANGVGAPTAFYFLPSALIREFIAILVIYKWLNIMFLLGVISLVIISMSPF